MRLKRGPSCPARSAGLAGIAEQAPGSRRLVWGRFAAADGPATRACARENHGERLRSTYRRAPLSVFVNTATVFLHRTLPQLVPVSPITAEHIRTFPWHEGHTRPFTHVANSWKSTSRSPSISFKDNWNYTRSSPFPAQTPTVCKDPLISATSDGVERLARCWYGTQHGEGRTLKSGLVWKGRNLQ